MANPRINATVMKEITLNRRLSDFSILLAKWKKIIKSDFRLKRSAVLSKMPRQLAKAKPITTEMIQQATVDKKFLKPSGGTLLITGAARQFSTNPNMVYLTTVRLAGPRSEVERTLQSMGYDANAVENLFNQAITAQNYKTNPQYQAELGNVQSTRTKAKPVEILAGPSSKTSPKAVAPKVAKAAAPKKGLADRVAALPAGMVLDVSAIKPDGTGIRQFKAPKTTGKLTAGPFISTSEDSLRQALQMLGEDYEIVGPTRDGKGKGKAPIREVSSRSNLSPSGVPMGQRSPAPPTIQSPRVASPVRATSPRGNDRVALPGLPRASSPLRNELQPLPVVSGFNVPPAGTLPVLPGRPTLPGLAGFQKR